MALMPGVHPTIFLVQLQTALLFFELSQLHVRSFSHVQICGSRVRIIVFLIVHRGSRQFEVVSVRIRWKWSGGKHMMHGNACRVPTSSGDACGSHRSGSWTRVQFQSFVQRCLSCGNNDAKVGTTEEELRACA